MSTSPELPAPSEVGSPGPNGEDEEEGVDEGDCEDEESLAHLREISPLASWTVSTFKPGCGVAALLNPSTNHFWQSDGPQPHLLNIHFFKLVTIVRLRVYLDLELDESYTPTRMLFLAGHSEYDVVDFAEWRAPPAPEDGPRGWEEISLEGCAPPGVDDESQDENDPQGALRCMFLQIRVLENHQNGKDTHIRGVQVWARDERLGRISRSKPQVQGTNKNGPTNAELSLERLDLYPDEDFGEGEIR